MPLKPLPPTQIAIARDDRTPTQEYAEYLASLDQLLRSAPGFTISEPPVIDTNAAGHVISAANLLAGVLLRSGPAGAFNDTTPSASEIIGAIPKSVIGTSRLIFVGNGGGGAMAFLGGSGVTTLNTAIAPGFGRWFLVTVTGASVVTLRGLMTGAM